MAAGSGVFGSIVIARWPWGLMRNTGAVLVDAAATLSRDTEIREAFEDGDALITDLHVWRVGPGKFAAARLTGSVTAADAIGLC